MEDTYRGLGKVVFITGLICKDLCFAGGAAALGRARTSLQTCHLDVVLPRGDRAERFSGQGKGQNLRCAVPT